MLSYAFVIVFLFLSVVAAADASASATVSTVVWKGEWIWADALGAKSPKDAWVCFRRQVTAPGGPVKLRIAVEGRYRLWVDGRIVVHDGGLKRGPKPDATWYDEVDLGQMSAGPHTIAILAWYWGRSTFDTITAEAPGLLVDADGLDVASNASWKVLRHPAFGTSAHKPDYRLVEYSILWDQNRDPGQWMQPSFVDSAWSAAVPVGTAGGKPWGALWRRPIPQMEWLPPQAFVAPAVPFTTDAKTSIITTVLPDNLQFVPRIRLRDSVGGHLVIADAKKRGNNSTHQHAWTTAPGEQTLEGWTWVTAGPTGRIEWTIPEGIEVLELGWQESRYPVEFAGSFASNDPFLDLLWRQARRTVAVNLRETIMGCPDRERGGFLGDQNVDFCVLPYAFAHQPIEPLVRLCVGNIARWQHPSGALPCVAPGTFNGEFPAMALTYIGPYGIHETWRQTGDVEPWRLMYDAARRYVDLYTFDQDGLVQDRAGGMNNWKDWGSKTTGARSGVILDDRLLMNCWYAGAMQALIEAAPLVGRPADAEVFRSRLDRIRGSFAKVFWTGTGYRSPDAPWLGTHHDDRGNALAVCLGLADSKHRETLCTLLRTETLSGPMLDWHVVEALIRLGDSDSALDRLRQRYAYITNGTYTLGEFWGANNHGYAAGPLAVLSGWIAGVRPLEAGYRKIAVLPRPGRLNSVNCEVSTVAGSVRVQFSRSATAPFRLETTVPAPAELGIPTAELPTGVKVVDGAGNPLWPTGTTANSAQRCLGMVEDHLRFAVPAGTWILEVRRP